MILFAHHVELYHVPVLLALFAAGVWIGWQLIGKIGKRRLGENHK